MVLTLTFAIPLSFWGLSPFFCTAVFIAILLFGCGIIMTYSIIPSSLSRNNWIDSLYFLAVLSQSFALFGFQHWVLFWDLVMSVH